MTPLTKEDKSRKFMVGSSDSETENEDLALLHLVLRKLSIKDQTLLHRQITERCAYSCYHYYYYYYYWMLFDAGAWHKV